MKFTIQTILSFPVDGASCHMLTFNNTIRILLDCGIGPSFDIIKYRERAEQLKTVCLVLVSHSQMQYSGALCFLVDELGLSPKIFYTTQPIMRCSPLNLHEGLLSLHCPNYNKKVFNRIYKIYQNVNIIKTQQKKSVEVTDEGIPGANPEKAVVQKMQEQVEPTIGEVEKIIYFTCYSAGSSMGNLAWRISFGLVNILYMVEYNNYSLHHIGGIDLSQVMQPTDILITDACPDINDYDMNKNKLYSQVKDAIVSFYERHELPVSRPPPMTNQEGEGKLLLCCWPGELVMEVMAVARKVLEELQPVECREKVRVIHLSSRYLQLIKSQIDYFSSYFKDTLENIEQFFIHSKNLSGRINIAPSLALQTLINDQLSKSVQVLHLGNFPTLHQQKGLQNVTSLNLFLPDEKLLHSASRIEQEINQDEPIQQQAQKAKSDKDDRSQVQDQTEIRQTEKSDLLEEVEDPEGEQFQLRQPLHGKYFSQIGFPQFLPKPREEEHDFDQYGIRHQYARFAERQTIEEYRQDQNQQNLRESEAAQKKNATIQVMNIEFRIPEPDRYIPVDFSKFQVLNFCANRTNFNSSIQIILTLKPANVILINTKTTLRSADELVQKYKTCLTQHKNQGVTLYQLAPKNYCHLKIYNELISYKVNYIPIPADRKVQKVKGVINYSNNGLLCIHLECLDQKELLDFRLDKFYRRLKTEKTLSCTFTRQGIIVQGICISREGKSIILEGDYSQNYFKVRRLLYEFLQIE